MSDTIELEGAETPTGSKKGLLFGLIAALVLGGAGFYAAYSGLIGGPSNSATADQKKTIDGKQGGEKGGDAAAFYSSEVAFVALEPLIVSLSGNTRNRYLRFGAQLEVLPEFEADVAQLLPRVRDVLNEYLRAVDSRDIEDSATLGRLRSQMLRRIQLVTGKGRVRDLLITEFVLN